MNNEEFLKNINKYKIPLQKWVALTEIEGLIIDNGVGIYPDPLHKRFFITKTGEIFIQYGKSLCFGDELIGNFNLEVAGSALVFDRASFRLKNGKFRFPKEGDIIQITKGVGNILISSYIMDIIYSQNNIVIDLSNPIFWENGSMISFYDPKLKTENSFISNAVEGQSFNFEINKPYLNDRKVGNYHKIIKIKNIKEIIEK